MMVIVKFNGKWVHVVKFARDVKFSNEQDWFMVCFDFEKANRKREQFKWIPASTRFDAVKEIIGE